VSRPGRRVECEIPAAAVERFAAGDTEGSARRAILEHLLAGCESCRTRLSALGGYTSPREARAEDEAATARLVARLRQTAAFFDREHAEAAALFEPFLAHPTNRRWTLIRNSRRYDNWSFAARLLDAAYEALYHDARETLELAEMALELVPRLDAEAYGVRLVHDLEGRARALRGNARRTLGDLRAAALDLRAARRLLADGSGDPLAEAELDYFEASWHVDSGDARRALATIRRSIRVYRELGEEHLEGRSLNSEGHILSLLGRSEASFARLRAAARKVDPERDPHLALAVRHNLVWLLVEADEVEEALWQLASYEREFERLSQGSALTKLGWLRARILVRTGERDRGEHAFREAIRAFAGLELPLESALVALDLCGLYAEEGRWPELRALAADTLSLFRSLGVASEAVAAWIVLQRAAEREAVTVALLHRLSTYYTAAGRTPGLRFEA